MEPISDREVYEAYGFTRWDGVSPAVEADEWRRLQGSERLEDIRRRYLIRRDRTGHPIVVKEGYVIGFVPALSLNPEQLERFLSRLTEGMARGLETADQLRDARRGA